MKRSKSPEEYLGQYIRVEDKTDCHIMTKVPMKSGYVLVNRVGWAKIYKVSMAHQLSYIIHNGEYDRSLNINHICHNRACVNPEHLYAGTQKENMKDKCDINRQHRPRGDLNGMSKLNSDQVKEIKTLLKIKSLVDIAEMFDVCRQHIGDIKNGKRWKHV